MMFWSKPKLPVTLDSQQWIEKSFDWFLREFGKDRFLQHRSVLPTTTFYPDKYLGTEESVLLVVRRTCQYMDVQPDSVEVHFFEEHEELSDPMLQATGEFKSGAAGLYFHKGGAESKARIAIHSKQLKQPMSLVATIAHELGHVILLGGGRISREDKSHEYLTDLLTVFLGMGIFTANAAFQFQQWRDSRYQGWKVSRQGYMSEEMFGYALAGYCWLRGERKPGWTDTLAMNVQHYFKQSLAYLEKGGVTSLTPLK
jgi:hypothetical protein